MSSPPRVLLFFLLFTFSLAVSPAPELTISHVSTLLSWESEGAIIRTTGPNCFYWSLADDTFVAFEAYPPPTSSSPLVALCSRSVRIFPREVTLSNQLPRHSTQLIARDSKTGQLLKCDVFVDTIFSLRLLTTLRRLYLDEMQLIEVQALDVAENVFSTPALAGLTFEWESSSDAMVLSHIDSELEPGSGTGLELEVRDSGTPPGAWMRLARGSRIGKSWLEVNLLYDLLRPSQPISVLVEFAVVDRFLLEPGDNLFIIPNSVFRYQLYRIRREIQTLITMPSTFRWLSTNTTVVSIDHRIGKCESNDNLGYSSIRVYDSEFQENEIWGIVSVVEPVRLRVRFEMIDGKNPFVPVGRILDSNLVLDRKYYVRIEALDASNHVVLKTDNIQFFMKITEGQDLIQIDRERGGEKRATTLEIGEVVIHARMKTDDGRRLETTDVFRIYEAVRINHELDQPVLLPIDKGVRQEWYGTASGGAGQYVWHVVDDAVAVLSQDYSNVIISRAVGRTVVVTFDRDNVHNWDSRPLKVSKPHSVKFLPSYRETAVGDDLCLHVAVRNALLEHFSNYTRMNLTFSVDGMKGNQVFRYSLSSRQCEVSKYDIFAFRAEREGFATVDVQYTRFMRDAVNLAAFPPFEIVSPEFIRMNPIVVSLGAGVPVILSGGPVAWENPPSTISSAEDIPRSDLVQFDIVEKMRHYYIGCLDYGKQTIRFTIQNDIEEEGAWPTVVSISKLFSCQPPETIELFPLDANTRVPYIPFLTSPPPVVFKVRNDQILPLQMQAFSPHGNRFVNFSTLITNWALQDENTPRIADLHVFREGMPHDERPLELFKDTGIIHAYGELVRFDREMVKRSGANIRSLPAVFQPIDDLVQLRITSGMAIRFFCGLSLSEEVEYLWKRNETMTDRCLITSGFFCEDPPHMLFPSKRSLQLEGLVSGGSGSFDIWINDTTVTELRIGDDGRFTLIALDEGYVKIRATDKVFSGAKVSSVVKVSDAEGVSIHGSRFVKEKTSGYVQIAPWDGNGNVFDPSQVSDMEYFLEIKTVEGFPPAEEIINFKDCGSGKYEVYGKMVGQVNLLAYVTNAAGKILRNDAFTLVVYEEFRPLPPRLLLVPGSIYQVGTSGGPVGVSSITTEFEKVNQVLRSSPNGSGKVLDINARGLVTALDYGQLTVIIRKFWNRELIAELRCEIFVVELEGISTLPSPAMLLYESSQAPGSIVGLSRLGTLSLLSLQSVFLDIAFDVTGNFELVTSEVFGGFRVNSRSAGHGSVRAKLSFRHPILRSYNHSVHLPVTVDEPLEGHCTSCSLFVPPRSSLSLKSNKEDVSYTAVRLESNSHLLEVEPHTGLVQTGEMSGIAGVLSQFAGRHVFHLVTIEDPAFVDYRGDVVRIEMKHQASQRMQLVFRAHEGDTFASVRGVPLRITMNDLEIVHIDEGRSYSPDLRSFLVRTLGSGVVTVEVASEVEGRIANPLYLQFVVSPKIDVGLRYNMSLRRFTAYVGDSFRVTASPLMQDETGSFWSSRSDIFDVSKHGLVTALSAGSAKVSYNSVLTGSSASRTINVRKLTSVRLVSPSDVPYRPGSTTFIEFQMIDGTQQVYSRPPEDVRRQIKVAGFCDRPKKVRVLATEETFDGEKAIYTMQLEMLNGLTSDTRLSCGARVSYPRRDEDVPFPRMNLIVGGTQTPRIIVIEEDDESTSGPSLFSQLVVALLIILVTVFVYNHFLSSYCR